MCADGVSYRLFSFIYFLFYNLLLFTLYSNASRNAFAYGFDNHNRKSEKLD